MYQTKSDRYTTTSVQTVKINRNEEVRGFSYISGESGFIDHNDKFLNFLNSVNRSINIICFSFIFIVK